MHFGGCDPVQMRQAIARPEQVGAEDGLAGLHRQHFQDLLVGRAAVAGDMDFGNTETGMGQDRADAIVDGARGAADHAAGEQGGQQRKHHGKAGHRHHGMVGKKSEARHHPPEETGGLVAADGARLHLGQAVVGAQLGGRAGGADRAAGLAFHIQRSHDASSTIQRHNFA